MDIKLFFVLIAVMLWAPAVPGWFLAGDQDLGRGFELAQWGATALAVVVVLLCEFKRRSATRHDSSEV